MEKICTQVQRCRASDHVITITTASDQKVDVRFKNIAPVLASRFRALLSYPTIALSILQSVPFDSLCWCQRVGLRCEGRFDAVCIIKVLAHSPLRNLIVGGHPDALLGIEVHDVEVEDDIDGEDEINLHTFS
jgi:hypothetical protein